MHTCRFRRLQLPVAALALQQTDAHMFALFANSAIVLQVFHQAPLNSSHVEMLVTCAQDNA